MRLGGIVRGKAQLLDEIFGEGAYRVDVEADHLVRVCTGWMELLLIHDRRDQFVSSSVKPLKVPDSMSEDHTTDTFLRFLDIQVGARRKSPLDERQVMDELNRIRPLVPLLRDDCASRDAVGFVNGYNTAYTDHFSGMW